MNLLKYCFVVASLLTLILLCCIFTDLYFTRGFFLNYLVASPQMGELTNDFEGEFEYTIHKKANGNFGFRLQNKSIFPFNLILYRYGSPNIYNHYFYSLPDSTLFDYATRAKLNYPINVKKQGYGFDCGTGIGVATLNPFEEFDLEMSQDELLEHIDLFQDLTLTLHRNDSTFLVDFIYLEPIVVQSNQEEYSLVRDSKITEKDSVDVEFYLPVYSIFTGKQFDIYSNCIRFSYLDMITEQMNNYNEVSIFF